MKKKFQERLGVILPALLTFSERSDRKFYGRRYGSFLWRFFLCNLLAAVGRLGAELCFTYPLEILFGGDTARAVCSSVGFFLSFCTLYFLFFRRGRDFHAACGLYREAGLTPAEATRRWLASEGLHAGAVLLTAMAAVTLIPARYVDPGSSAGDTGITVILSSSELFTNHLHEWVLGADTVLTRLAGALVWGLCMAVGYILLTRRAFGSFMAEGYVPRRISIRPLLIGAGLFFEIAFILHALLSLWYAYQELPPEDNTAWFIMLTSLLHVIVCMVLWFVETVIAVSRRGGAFAVVRLVTLCVCGFIMTGTLFYSEVETAIALSCLGMVTVLQIAAWIRGDKKSVPTTPSPAEAE